MGVISIDSGQQSTTIGTEHSLTQLIGIGIYVLNVDLDNMIAGDTVIIRISTTCRSIDPLHVAQEITLTDVQDEPNWMSIPIPLASSDEIQATIEQSVGVSRVFPWNMRRM